MFTAYAKRLKDWFYKNAEADSAKWWLAVISFTESSFFPIPPDPFLMAILMVKRHVWLSYSLIVVGFSVLGAVFGYFIGFAFYEVIGAPLVDFYHLNDELIYITKLFEDNLFWTMFTAAFTPIPFKLFTIAGGLFKVNFLIFIIASFFGRAIRFLIIGYIMNLFGEKIGELIFKYFNRATLLVVLMFIIYILIKIFL